MFKLQIIDNPSRSIWLVGERVTLGSHHKNQLVLGSVGSEEFHAEIVISDDKLCLNSLNGRCYVNGLLTAVEYELKAGDVLRIGKETLQIVDSGSLISKSPVEKPDFGRSVKDPVKMTWVLVSKHRALQNREYVISEKSILGRSSDCDICIPHKMLSRKHAEIVVENTKLIVRDLDSSNSVYHNGIKIKQVEVFKGDTLTFGNLEFSVDQRLLDNSGDAVETSEMPDSMNHTMIRPTIELGADIKRSKTADAPPESEPSASAGIDQVSASIRARDGYVKAPSQPTLTAVRDDNVVALKSKQVAREKLIRVVIYVVVVTLVIGVLSFNFGIFR